MPFITDTVGWPVRPSPSDSAGAKSTTALRISCAYLGGKLSMRLHPVLETMKERRIAEATMRRGVANSVQPGPTN